MGNRRAGGLAPNYFLRDVYGTRQFLFLLLAGHRHNSDNDLSAHISIPGNPGLYVISPARARLDPQPGSTSVARTWGHQTMPSRSTSERYDAPLGPPSRKQSKIETKFHECPMGFIGWG